MSLVDAAVSAAAAVCGAAGIDVRDPQVLKEARHVVVWLRPAPVVAKIHSHDERFDAMECEIRVAAALAEVDAPSVRPAVCLLPRVHRHGAFGMTFWSYLQDHAEQVLDPVAYVRTLRSLHTALAGLDVVVPDLQEAVVGAAALAGDASRTPRIENEDRSFLQDALESLWACVLAEPSGFAWQRLHGEPHKNNIIRTTGGPRFIDFERACFGPIEYDVADVPEAVAAEYEGLNHRLLELCRTLLCAQVAVWCLDVDVYGELLVDAGHNLIGEVRVAQTQGRF